MPRPRTGERRQHILETLARLLQERRGEPITTAVLAQAVGVSEAALYRHFPSKAKMYEALIEFIEASLFSRINRILTEEPAVELRIHGILRLVLGFAEKNPGISSIMHGGALAGDMEHLRQRIARLFDRIETQLRQVLREGEARHEGVWPVAETANLFLALMEGRIAQSVRSGFAVSPLQGFERQWELLRALFAPVTEQAPP